LPAAAERKSIPMEPRRRVFIVVGIVVILAGLFFILTTLGFLREEVLFGYEVYGLADRFDLTALGFLILAAGVLMIVLGGTGGRYKKSGSIVSFTELGEVRISFQAIESMVLTASRKIKGVLEVNTQIDSSEQGLIIYLRIKTIPDLPIPGLVGSLQEEVRRYVQEISGASVAEVKVLVENLAQEKIQRNVR